MHDSWCIKYHICIVISHKKNDQHKAFLLQGFCFFLWECNNSKISLIFSSSFFGTLFSLVCKLGVFYSFFYYFIFIFNLIQKKITSFIWNVFPFLGELFIFHMTYDIPSGWTHSILLESNRDKDVIMVFLKVTKNPTMVNQHTIQWMLVTSTRLWINLN
jgi:hypothetical protein